MYVLRLLMQHITHLLHLGHLGKSLIEWLVDVEELLAEDLLGEVAHLVHQLGDLHLNLLLHLVLPIVRRVLGLGDGRVERDLDGVDLIHEFAILFLLGFDVKLHEGAEEVHIRLDAVLNPLVMFFDVLQGLDLLDIALHVNGWLGDRLDLVVEP